MSSNLIYQYFHWTTIHVSSAIEHSLVLHIRASHFIIFEWKIHFYVAVVVVVVVVVCNKMQRIHQKFNKIFLFIWAVFSFLFFNVFSHLITQPPSVWLAERFAIVRKWKKRTYTLLTQTQNVRFTKQTMIVQCDPFTKEKINVSLTKKHDKTDNCYTANAMIGRLCDRINVLYSCIAL